MKTTKPGDLSPQSSKPFWAGRTITCPKCKAEMELEAKDKPANPVLSPGKTCFYCSTPGCGTLIEVKA